ncbi:MAG: hypothetical protein QGH80_08490, partial [Acidimicrobiales bacterium]|nr:hypothetical protein [Acidimicrobiales bacterium]
VRQARRTKPHRAPGHGTSWSQAALPSDNINSPTVEQSGRYFLFSAHVLPLKAAARIMGRAFVQ